MADDVTAILSEWGERFEEELNEAVAEECDSLERSLSLVAAVEAVLKPHQPGRIVIFGILCKRHENHRFFSITSTEADDVRGCPDCAATVYASCTGCAAGVSVDVCPVRGAIAAALAGTARENVSSSSAATREDGERG